MKSPHFLIPLWIGNSELATENALLFTQFQGDESMNEDTVDEHVDDAPCFIIDE